MAKYGITARVVDSDGDAGEVVDKRKGERLVRYDRLDFPVTWVGKSALKVEAWVPKVGDVVDDTTGGGKATIREIRADGRFSVDWGDGCKGEIFWTDDDWTFVSRPATPAASPEKGAYAFKVGDRVNWTRVRGEFDGATIEAPDTMWDFKLRATNGRTTYAYTHELEPLTVAEQPAGDDEFTLEVGKTYKSRDGSKVGPMTKPVIYEEWPFQSPHGSTYRADGTQAYRKGDLRGADLVAEWGEPPTTIRQHFDSISPTTWAPVAGKFGKTRDGRKVGPMRVYSATYFHVKSGSFLGDQLWSVAGTLIGHKREFDLIAEWPADVAVAPAAETPVVKSGETWRGESGALHAVEANPDNEFWPLKTAGVDVTHDEVRFWKVDGEPYNPDSWNRNAATGDRLVSPVAPERKFKVGDRVHETNHPTSTAVVTELIGSKIKIKWDGLENVFGTHGMEGFSLAPTPTLPPSTRVTITGKGRVTARTGTHTHVVIDGAAPGQNSFAIPTHLLAAE